VAQVLGLIERKGVFIMTKFEYFLYGPSGIGLVRGSGATANDFETPCAKSEQKEINHFEIKCVLSNHEKGVFTVKWTDGTVTMVTCQPGDDWDDEKALAMCFMKKALGNKGAFNNVMRDALDKMTVIPEKKKAIPAVAPAETKAQSEFAETMKTLQSKAAEAGKNMKEAISRLLNENTKKKEKLYTLCLVKGINMEVLGANLTKADIFNMMDTYKQLHYPELVRNNTPIRCWEHRGDVCVDFGAFALFKIEGMSVEEFLAK
jgi:hypothetical protein